MKESEETDDEASEINETEDTTTVSTTQTSAAPSASPSPSASVSVRDLTTRPAFTQETTTTVSVHLRIPRSKVDQRSYYFYNKFTNLVRAINYDQYKTMMEHNCTEKYFKVHLFF